MTRRTLVGTLAAAAGAALVKGKPVPHSEWKPRLGILGKFTPNNVEFARTQGFTNMILNGPDVNLSDQDVEHMRSVLKQNEMNVSAFQVTQNHIAPDPAQRAKANAHFVKSIELAGRMGV
ncbi:MAG TPA: sugar phosphate isomerase/epimerase, partial [Bryobacteraceae bacterium]|nr:sugar phosphate isomerase/epimerase [Bryobacteraceae bacterium]